VMPPGECDLGHVAHPTNRRGPQTHRHVRFRAAPVTWYDAWTMRIANLLLRRRVEAL
jgi:hypothetical protein